MPQRGRKAAAAAVPPALRLSGSLDRADPDGTVEGWCWSPDAPDQARPLAVLIDGAEVARLVADQERPDLAAAGLGSGRHAFLLRLDPAVMRPGAAAVVTLRDRLTGQQIGAAARVQWQQPELPPEPLPLLHGHLDRVSRDGWVSGWCWYPDLPGEHVKLTVLVDDAPVGSLRADTFRPDLQQAGIGDGSHGFAFALPYSALAERGTLTVAVQESGTGRNLSDPITMRLGRMAAAEERIQDLERQLRLLRGQIEEMRRAGAMHDEDRAARALFATVAAFFQNLAEGRAGPGGDVAGALGALTSRFAPLALALAERPRASICIAATAGVDALYHCLASLHDSQADAAADVIVLDDGREPTTALLPAVVRNLSYLHLPDAGLIGGLNDAARDARGEFLVFLSPQARLAAGWLDEVTATFAAAPEAAAVGGRVLREDGLLQHAGLLAAADGTLRDPGRLAAAELPEHRFLRRVDALASYAFAVRRAAFVEVGGFSLLYARLGHAAVDLCARLRAADRTILYQPLATALWIDPSRESEADPPDLALADEETLRLRERLRHEGWPAAPAAARFAGHALVIDDDLPHRDRDAGSVVAFEQMLLLRRLNYRVTFAPVHAARLADKELDDLARHGIEVAAPPHCKSVTEFLKEAGERLDLVQIHRYPNAAMLFDRVRELAPRAKLVLAVEDLHFLREQRRAALAGHAVPASVREEEVRCIRAADATVVRSDFEQGLLRAEVDAERLVLLRWIAEPQPPREGFAGRRDICFVGNFRHPPNVDGVHWFVERVLPLLRAELPGVRLRLAGSDMPASVRELASDAVEVVGWVADLAALFGAARLSVAPLRFGAGFKGKIATSLAHGLPVVGSSISLEGTGLAPGDGVAIADEPAEFAREIVRLHENAELWQAQSERALERVAALYAPAAALETVRAMLRRLGLPAA